MPLDFRHALEEKKYPGDGKHLLARCVAALAIITSAPALADQTSGDIAELKQLIDKNATEYEARTEELEDLVGGLESRKVSPRSSINKSPLPNTLPKTSRKSAPSPIKRTAPATSPPHPPSNSIIIPANSLKPSRVLKSPGVSPFQRKPNTSCISYSPAPRPASQAAARAAPLAKVIRLEAL